MTALTLQKQHALIEALQMNEFPAEEQEQMLLDLSDLVFKGSMIRLIERMDGDTREAFSALLESDPSEDDVLGFVDEHVPGYDEVVTETLEDITGDILAATGN